MHPAPTSLPPRPNTPLTPLAEAIHAAVATHMQAVRGGNTSAAEDARRTVLAQFADIGVSQEYLRLFARMIQS